ncbi:outer membrane lipoprotein carrier protein LolA [Alteromonas sp. C1M14]|uniref:outer membrane lipoprotein carrier protein LolA n=1 Tax=Alteromonas sp. C1M14 TaxID=2841567 RepID=UPI001C081733|nr:outer membrane lipoprotein carrier protein LolA [Alteromonas sp. C1M14]MBU2979664.1 outer membrane lipoprotein carrier protein LolA [Alteromonas sp. C1M14]
MIHRFTVFVCLWLLTVCAYGKDISIDTAKARLALEVELPAQGDFTQEKHLAILKHPFVSSGRYRLNQEQLVWETLAPAPQTLTMEKQNVFLWDEAAGRREMPQAKPFASLIQQLLTGNLDALANSFTFADEPNRPNCVSMQPKSRSIASVFAGFLVCGKSHITTITMTDNDGNITLISLTPTR